jgi:hypothetical protein
MMRGRLCPAAQCAARGRASYALNERDYYERA